jgi:hypothetical protein
MFYLLNPKVWVALAVVGALAFSHVFVYRKGANHVRLEWNAAKAAALEDAQKLERARQSAVDAAARAGASRALGISTDRVAAGSERDGLLNDLRAAREHAAQSRAAADRTIATLGELLDRCSAEYLRVAEEADRAYSEVRTLREGWPR